MKKVDIIVDLQFGSTGKGLICGYLANKVQHDVAVTANMPNAGHTFIDRHGNKMVHKVLPNGIVSPRCKYALIGPGAVYDPARLVEEVDAAYELGYDHFKVLIHPNSVPLELHHKKLEEKTLTGIGSTCQGSSAAMVEKIERKSKTPIISRDVFGCFNHSAIRVCDHKEYRSILKNAHSILAEGAQGFSLGINEEFYPYCTSRSCDPARFLSDMGIPINYLRKIVGVARVHPIRVGGTSGGCYSDQKELEWSDIGVEPETTTVTGRTRRVFTFSEQQIEDAMWAMSPDEVFVNFMNYANDDEVALMDKVFGNRLRYIGHGPMITDVYEV